MIDRSLFPPKSYPSRLLALALLVIFIITSTGCLPTGNPELQQVYSLDQVLLNAPVEAPQPDDPPAESAASQPDGPHISLRAASGKTILFRTQNGRKVDGVEPQSFDIPHLVLFRNSQLTDAAERSLSIDIQGLDIPPTGLSATLALETQHKSPPPEGGSWSHLRVWSHTLDITNTLGFTQSASASITLDFEFTETIPSSPQPVLTPTDYYRFVLSLQETSQPEHQTNINLDYAFLLENQWIVPLPAVPESTPGAAPRLLVIYACDMFLSWIDKASTPLTRQGFQEILQDQLIPQMVVGFQVETERWGFTWYPEWTSYRQEDAPGRLSVALTDGTTWYHGVSLGNGSAAISITLDGWIENRSDTLVDGMLNTFYHELFHNLQRNILQHATGMDETRGKSLVWEYIAEGTATLAASIGQPALTFGSLRGSRGYLYLVNQFLFDIEPGKELNRSLRELEPRYSSLYWRFLYERCGGMRQGVEDPAAGMLVIRQVLETLYSGEVVDISASDDLVAYYPALMDRVLSASACPFHTFAESRTHFAHALYSLHLQDGRCSEPGLPGACQLYDPNGIYLEPPVARLRYAGQAVNYAAQDQGPFPGIRGSFGMDFVEVQLAPESGGQPLKLEFFGVPGSTARFSLQILPLKDDENGLPSVQVSDQPIFIGEWDGAATREQLVFEIPSLESQSYNRLGLVITRLDNREADDPVGAYTLALHP